MRRVALVSVGFFVVSALLAALAVPAQAGTAAAPEMTDKQTDVMIAGSVPDPMNTFAHPADLRNGYIAAENATLLSVVIDADTDIAAGIVSQAALGFTMTYLYAFTATMNGTTKTITATVTSAAAAAPTVSLTADNGATAVFQGGNINMTFARSLFGGKVPVGTKMTGLALAATGRVVANNAASGVFTDAAMDTTSDYTITVPPPPPKVTAKVCDTAKFPYRSNETASSKADTDGDCLPNWFEKKFFGNATSSQNATMDKDGDGFSNYAEYIAGTDPSSAASKPGSGTSTFPNGNPACVYKAGETNKNDTDGDCLPNYWEKQFFGNNTAADPTADADKDGFTNYQEYLNGTDPKDPTSKPASGCTFKTGETNTTDVDGDCLPDYWEKQFFNNTSSQNGVGDPDGDFCNNSCEYKGGTDPTKANPSTSNSSSSSSGGDSPLDKLTQHADYLAESAGAAVVVVTVCIIALVRRWVL